MAVNESRSMNNDLREGITDGTVKKVNPNRGGTPNDNLSARGVYDALDSSLYDPSFSELYKAEYADRLTTIRG